MSAPWCFDTVATSLYRLGNSHYAWEHGIEYEQVKNYVKPKQPAQVDSLWSLEPGSSIRTEPDFSVSAAQTILPQGLHFQKLVPNGQWHRPRTGGRPFVPGEVGLFEW